MTRRPPKDTRFTRRELLKLLGMAGLTSPFAGGLSPLLTGLNPQAMAQSATPHKFIQIFLMGGWDSALATDPVAAGSGKATGGVYNAAYYNAGNGSYMGAPAAVAGKSNLLLGPGMANAAPALALAPTAFVNGLFVQVTAHELAVNYLYSGQLSLSRSREFPAIVATMADKSGGFPAHVILGSAVPLSTTAATNPPLQSLDTDLFADMLAGPYSDGTLSDATIAKAHALVDTLNAGFQARLGVNSKASLSAWNASEAGLASLYSERYDQRLVISGQMHTDFASAGAGSPGAKLAMAGLVLKESLSRFVTVNFGGFDTHSSHKADHLPLMATFATSLKALVNYLIATNDPDTPAKKLIETTTVLVTSEFVRTPMWNGASGTDHWQSGSAMLIGRGVQDNTVVGSTDNGGAVQNYGADKLLPEHLSASILRHLGFTAEADLISGVHLSALFA